MKFTLRRTRFRVPGLFSKAINMPSRSDRRKASDRCFRWMLFDFQPGLPASKAGRCFRMRQPVAPSHIQQDDWASALITADGCAAGIHYGCAAAIRHWRVRHPPGGDDRGRHGGTAWDLCPHPLLKPLNNKLGGSVRLDLTPFLNTSRSNARYDTSPIPYRLRSRR